MLLVRFLAVPLTVGALALVLGGALAPASASAHGPVYSLAALEAQLDRTPQGWVGRAVLVSAVAEPCSMWSRRTHLDDCGDRPLLLVSMCPEPDAAPLPLIRPAQPRIVALLEGVPLAGTFLSRLLRPIPAPSWGAEATFAVRLEVADSGSNGAPPSYYALLLAALS
jgi:hypothetical protein